MTLAEKMELLSRLKELYRDLRKETHNLIVSNYLSTEDCAVLCELLNKDIGYPVKKYEPKAGRS